MSKRKCIGILREVKNKWERRVPLVPADVRKLTDSGVQVLVQPSNRRVFSDAEYISAGAILTEDISSANTIFSVKEIPQDMLIPGKAYVQFSHTIKGQPAGMPFLDACMEKNVRLIDYECIRGKEGRLVAFGKFAGQAGMVDTLRGVGERYLTLGYSTPFLGVSSSFMYPSIAKAKDALATVGEEIRRVGLPPSMAPASFAFTGNGNVSQGAQEMFDILPHRNINPLEASGLASSSNLTHELAKLSLRVEHLVARQDGSPFDRDDYYSNPHLYRPTFHEKIAPYTNVLVHGIYWDRRFPRVLTKEQVRDLCDPSHPLAHKLPLGLVAVGDISCDIEGSIEFNVKASTIDRPFYIYDPQTELTTHNTDVGNGVLMMTIDNLPAEFPRDASEHFSKALSPFVEAMSMADTPLDQLPTEIRKSVITDDKQLAPDFRYIDQLRESQKRISSHHQAETSNNKKKSKSQPMAARALTVEGHLFDSGFINRALDIAEAADVEMRIVEWNVGKDVENPSSCVVQLLHKDETLVESTAAQIVMLAKVLPNADTRIAETPYAASVAEEAPKKKRGFKRNEFAANPTKQVLVLGSGFVASPVVEFLARQNKVLVASAEPAQAHDLVRTIPNASSQALDAKDSVALAKLVAQSDIVVSLLPATFQASIARVCIAHNKNLVTASYASPEMRTLHKECQDAGITVLNEVGLDPGIDHMSAMSVIHGVQAQGGRVRGFESVCGGLPAPEAANNPFGYKFSWNPRGVLTAAQNDAQYLRDGKVVQVAGANMLAHAEDIAINPAFSLETLPNRDSLIYRELYGLQDADTVFRGTLRYQGFSAIMAGFGQLGLLQGTDPVPAGVSTWSQLLSGLIQGDGKATSTSAAIKAYLQSLPPSVLSTHDTNAVDKCLAAAQWLGITSDKPLNGSAPSVMDELCVLLEDRLAYAENERDLVILHHNFDCVQDNTTTKRTSTLVCYGDEKWTAMARTVGLPTAISTQLIMDGKVSQKGVVIPTDAEIYKPVLEELEHLGVKFVETEEEADQIE